MSSELSGFPTLKPAFILKGKLGTISSLGKIHNGSTLSHFEVPTGTIESVPGFEPTFKANIHFVADWFSIDADGQRGRTDIRAIAKTEDGHAIDFRSQGILELGGPMAKIFSMAPDMATTPFGSTTGSTTVVVADPKLKALENSVFVTNSRMIVEETGVTVEMRMSLVVASTADN